eukprot:CAMPEP_0170545740 /NCGR_PEP_ID=MMETSP0211-20121228/4104_1 /TAXON_ID=311385 /ORGANISM="Pseudokeronopsis sp., Strain OXSARD2" /LENGTH=108 /DNA_ID=CAMNT_0010849809 /DNA_START=106 /DNA_END=432 /DNA_ORIENTATION=+
MNGPQRTMPTTIMDHMMLGPTNPTATFQPLTTTDMLAFTTTTIIHAPNISEETSISGSPLKPMVIPTTQTISPKETLMELWLSIMTLIMGTAKMSTTPTSLEATRPSL